MALKAADKKVVDAFTDGHKNISEGPKSSFYVRGGVLHGPTGARLAMLEPGALNTVVWVGTGGTSYQDDTYRYLKKTVPAKRFKGHGMRANGFFTKHLKDTKLSKAQQQAKLTPSQEEEYAYGLHLGMSPAQAKQYALKPNGRRNQKAGLGYVHDARTHDFLRPANREDMLKSLRSESGEYSEGGRRVYVRNGSSEDEWLTEQILRGFVLGFWLQGWAYAMEEAGLRLPHNITEESAPEPPPELTDFAMKFGLDISAENGGALLSDLAIRNGVDEEDAEEFGYHVAMQSLGHGVSWSDDHDALDFKIPSTEVHFELEDPDDEDSAVLVWAESSRRLAR